MMPTTMRRRLRPLQRLLERLRLACLVATAALLAGCAAQLQAPEALPEPPLVRRVDAQVGVVYGARLRSATVSTAMVRGDFGAANLARARQSLSAMFSQVVELPAWPPWREGVTGVDAVVEFDATEFLAALGNDYQRPDRAVVEYSMCVYRPDGTGVACWNGRSEQVRQRGIGECLPGLGACLQRLVDDAMLNALARLLVAFDGDPRAAALGRPAQTR